MSKEYTNYIQEHIDNVKKAARWLVDKGIVDVVAVLEIGDHDKSKYDDKEYPYYDDYFYGERTEDVKKGFDYAWLHHIHNNPHHWQYWVLFEEGNTKALEMPKRYVVEMVCDWWAFSWKKGNLYEVFAWYEEHKHKMMLHGNTRELVESILKQIKEELEKDNDTTKDS